MSFTVFLIMYFVIHVIPSCLHVWLNSDRHRYTPHTYTETDISGCSNGPVMCPTWKPLFQSTEHACAWVPCNYLKITLIYALLAEQREDPCWLLSLGLSAVDGISIILGQDRDQQHQCKQKQRRWAGRAGRDICGHMSDYRYISSCVMKSCAIIWVKTCEEMFPSSIELVFPNIDQNKPKVFDVYILDP